MIVYFDTNVYIAAKYQFETDKFATIRDFLEDGSIKVIYTDATIGEVKQHILEDIKAGVTQYNRLLRKELFPLSGYSELKLDELNVDASIKLVNDSLQRFLSHKNVIKISLNPIDAEKLMDDYFSGRPPFESKKPYEFKDAIMANAIKQYQEQINEKIYIVANDDGFRKVFEGDENFIVVKFLGNIIQKCYENKAQQRIESCIIEAMENDDFRDLINDFFSSFDIDRGYYSEWECDEFEIDDIELELCYIEAKDGKHLAHFSVDLYTTAEITHRDEDTSFYDKEEQRYLIENFVTWREHHKVETDVVVECEIKEDESGQYYIASSNIVDDRKFRTIDLDEYTMEDWDEISSEHQEEPDLEYCSECGSVIGYQATYTDYSGKPLCENCMVSNSHGDVCPVCGKKFPHELMNSGYCEKCFDEKE